MYVFRVIAATGAAALLALVSLEPAQLLAQGVRPASVDSATAKNPFQQLLMEVDLPPLPTDDADDDKLSVELGSIDAGDLAGCRVELFTDFAALDAPYQFTIRPNNADVPHDWSIYVNYPAKSNLGAAISPATSGLFKEPVSRIFVQSGHLYFSWNPNNITRWNSHLVNVFVELSSGSHSSAIRLRTPAVEKPVSLDLTDRTQRVPLRIANCPNAELLSIVVNDVEIVSGARDYESKFMLQGSQSRAGLDEPIVMRSSDAAKTQICVELNDGRTGPEIVLRTSYQYGGKRPIPFVAIDIMDSIQRLEQTLAEARAKLARAQAAAPSARARLRSLASRRTRNSQEEVAKIAGLSALKSEVNRANSSIRRFGRSIPKLEESLKELQTVRDVGASLHGNVKFHFIVVAENGKRSLDLARFGDAKPNGNSILSSAQ